MQKKLIALAVAGLVAAPAFAQSNVTISGIATVSVNNYKVGGANPARATSPETESRLDDNTSRFTLKGTEDLGGGLSAFFQIENRVSLDSRPHSTIGNSQGLADGESFVGISHKSLGSIGMGKYAMQYHEHLGYSEAYRALNTYATASAAILGSVNGSLIAGSTRQQNTIKYETPNFKGFSAKVLYSFNAFANEGNLATRGNAVPGATNYYTGQGDTVTNTNYSGYGKGRAWNVAARYYTGPINAFVSWYDNRLDGKVLGIEDLSDQKSVKAGFDYAFSFGLKAGIGYDRSMTVSTKTAHNPVRNAWLVPVSYAFGPNTVYVTYAKAMDISSIAGDQGARQLTVAYDRALSKRTFVGVSYMNLQNANEANYSPWLSGQGATINLSNLGGSGLMTGEKARQFSLNLTHFF